MLFTFLIKCSTFSINVVVSNSVTHLLRYCSKWDNWVWSVIKSILVSFPSSSIDGLMLYNAGKVASKMSKTQVIHQYKTTDKISQTYAFSWIWIYITTSNKARYQNVKSKLWWVFAQLIYVHAYFISIWYLAISAVGYLAI